MSEAFKHPRDMALWRYGIISSLLHGSEGAAKWGNGLNKALARFYDVTRRTAMAPIADIWWLRRSHNQSYKVVVRPTAP